MRYRWFASVMFCLFCTVAWAQPEPSWKTLAQEDGLLIEARPMPSTALREVRVQAHSPQPPAVIFAVLWNVREQAAWVPNIKELRVIKESAEEVVIYERVKIPVIHDRDYVLKLTRAIDAASGTYQISAIGASELGPPPPSGVVRMTRLSSTYTIKPASGGGSDITYVSFGDPTGKVPAWLIRAADVRGPKDFVKALLKRAMSLPAKP